MSVQTMRVGVLNTSRITGISVNELIGEIEEISGLNLPNSLPDAVNVLREKYGKKADYVVANTMFPFLITSDNPAPKKFKSLSKHDSTPEQIFVEVSSINWTRDVETAAIGGFFDKKKKKKRKGMPLQLLKKARKWVKGVFRKMRKSRDNIKISRKDIAVFAEDQTLVAALNFAAKKRKIPSNRRKAMRNYVFRKYARMAKVVGVAMAKKALKGAMILLKQAAKGPAPTNKVEAGMRLNAPGQKMSYFLTKYVGLPIGIMVSAAVMWQIYPTWTLCALGALGIAMILGGLNKYSKRNKKKGKKFSNTN
jgi:hypothetical protein